MNLIQRSTNFCLLRGDALKLGVEQHLMKLVIVDKPESTRPGKAARSTETISYTMSRVRSKNTHPELVLRKALWISGIRFRKHYKLAPGTPDIALVRAKIAVFCDGVFWHGRDWEDRKARLKTPNRDFWIRKIERNIKRDIAVNEELGAKGWLVIRFWEDEILADAAVCVDQIQNAISTRQSLPT